MFSENDSQLKKKKEEKERWVWLLFQNHRKDVDMYMLLILDLSGKALAALLHIWISVEKNSNCDSEESWPKRDAHRSKSLMFHSN